MLTKLNGKSIRIKFMKIQNLITPAIIIVAAVLMRLVPHPANVAPIAAMALFGGAYLDKKYALLLPLAAMFISDIFLGFHASMPMVYASLIITGLIGMWLKHHKSVPTVLFASVGASIIFFLLTNFNYWYATALYPKTLVGVIESYTMALPFFRNSLLGDLFYTGLFFGSYEFIKMTLFSKHSRLTASKK
jgi:hypothetical protein